MTFTITPTLPESYFSDLWATAFTSDTQVPSTKIDIRKGVAGPDTKTEVLDGWNSVPLELEVTDEVLFFMKDGIPTAFWNHYPKHYFGDARGAYLKDGLHWFGGILQETLAITFRDQIDDNPLVLVTDRYEYDDTYGYYFDTKYLPYVRFYGAQRELGLERRTQRSERITEENNDYWEAAFEYDINQDGFIPEYRSFVTYQKPAKSDVDGQVIIGKNKNEGLEGGDKDDFINGKKGNDVLTGNAGNDALLGNKGRDQLYGLSSDDYLSGGDGNDFLEGGKGADVFALSKGNDQIIDFSLGDGDRIFIQNKYINEFVIEQTESGSLLSVGSYGSLQLNVNLVDVDVIDYIVTDSPN